MNFRRELRVGSWVLILCSFALSRLVGGPSSLSANAQKSGIANSLQTLVVITKNWDDLHGTAQRYERSTPRGEWHTVRVPFSVVVGKTAWAGDGEFSLAARRLLAR